MGASFVDVLCGMARQRFMDVGCRLLGMYLIGAEEWHYCEARDQRSGWHRNQRSAAQELTEKRRKWDRATRSVAVESRSIPNRCAWKMRKRLWVKRHDLRDSGDD